jgi:predicted ATPase with chaperone activity
MAAAVQARCPSASGRPLKGVVVPTASATEAAVVEGIDVIPVSSLTEAVQFFSGDITIPPAPPRVDEWFDRFASYDVDFADVRGQEAAKRALCVAAAGQHNCLMVGPPGGGKTMLAKRVPTILPQLSAAESIETTRIYSALGLLQPGQPLLATRPFRAPHHSASMAALVGGGRAIGHSSGSHVRWTEERVAEVTGAHAGGPGRAGDSVHHTAITTTLFAETVFATYARWKTQIIKQERVIVTIGIVELPQFTA